MPTMQEIEIAQKFYEAEYSGDIYYVAATTQVEIAISLNNRRGIAIGIAILLSMASIFTQRFLFF